MKGILEKLGKFDEIDANAGVVFLLFSILTLYTLFLENGITVFIFIFFLAALLIWNCPRIGITSALLTVMIFGEKFSLLPVQINEQIYKIYALDVLMAITFISWFLRLRPGQKTFLNSIGNKKDIWLIAFFFIALFTLARSIFSGTDVELAIGTFKNYSYLIIYFLVFEMFNSWKEVRRILRTVFFGGSLLIVFIIWGFLAGKGLWSEATPGLRYLSGMHAYYITFPLIILFILMGGKEYFYIKFKTWLASIVLLVGLTGSMFRHLWIGFSLAVFVSWLAMKASEKKNTLKNAAILAGSGLIIMLFVFLSSLLFGHGANFTSGMAFSSLTNRAHTLFETGYQMESAAGWRLAAWQSALTTYAKSPILGLGFGQKFYLDYRDFISVIDVRDIHNDLLSILVQMGIIGFFPFVIFHIFKAKGIWTVLKINTDEKWMLLAVLGFGIIALSGAFFALYISFTGTALFYWVVMALISIIVKLILENEKYNNSHL